MDKKSRNWTICAVLTVLSIISFGPADDCSVEEENAGLCEYDEGLLMCGGISCLGAIAYAGLALMTKKEGDGQVIVIQQQPPTQVIQVQQPVVQQPQPPPPPAREMAKIHSAENQRKQAHLERGHELEMEGDLEGAITAYELAEEFKQAQRVRWALGKSNDEDGNGPSNVNISIGKVGDTSVKDSVITGADDEI